MSQIQQQSSNEMSLLAGGNNSGELQAIRASLKNSLASSGLPAELQQRLLLDVDGGEHYKRVAAVDSIPAVDATSSYCGTSFACCVCREGVMVPQGCLGLMKDDEDFLFLKPGYHTFASCGTEYIRHVSLQDSINRPVINGSTGFVVVTEGRIGVMLVGSTYKLLAPGVWTWRSPLVTMKEVVDITNAVVPLGPYTLVTVPEGVVAVTYFNGDLRVLGNTVRGSASSSAAAAAPAGYSQQQQQANPLKPNAAAAAAGEPVTAASSGISPRPQGPNVYFLSDSNGKWVFSNFLSLKEQTDATPQLDLLSKDNCEILMTAHVHWRCINPTLAIKVGGEDLEKIRAKVINLARCTIARIVAGTLIGQGGGTGATTRRVVQGQVVAGGNDGDDDDADADSNNKNKKKKGGADDTDLSHLMHSEMAHHHMKELESLCAAFGVEVNDIFVPERRLRNDDIRREIANMAVIKVRADAERSAADAKAYATVRASEAEAEAIARVAQAHADAGNMLGSPETTAARMALTEITAKSLGKGANVTLFSGAPDQMPFLFSAPPAGAAAPRTMH